jgi:hypothetical protein
MGLLRDVVADEGVIRLAGILLSLVGTGVAIWFVVRWSHRVN